MGKYLEDLYEGAEAKSVVEAAEDEIERLLEAIRTVDDCICNDREEEALRFIANVLQEYDE